jgi:hypothetical protein
LNTATFTEADGRTTLTAFVEAPSKDIRDAITESGMEQACRMRWISSRRSRPR